MNSDPNTCVYLSVKIVLEIHAAAIRKFGGSSGVRDTNLIETAVAAPQATSGGKGLRENNFYKFMNALVVSRLIDSTGIQLARRLDANAFVLYFSGRFNDRESVVSADVDRF